MRDDVGCVGLVLIPVGLSLPFWFSHPAVTHVNELTLAIATVVLGLLLFFVVAPRLPEEKPDSRRRGSGGDDEGGDDGGGDDGGGDMDTD